MADEGFKRKLAAILSADVIGYSRLMRDDEEATVRDIAAHRVLITEIVQQHNGRVVDSPGDNILAEFASVVDAVNGAIKIQREIKESNAGIHQDRRMEFRIGINLGDVIEEDERIYGDGVNIAARVEGLAAGGGIAISGTVYEHIKDKLSLGYHYLGEQDVKNIPEPVRIYRLLTEPADVGKMIGEEKPKSNKLLWTAAAAIVLIILSVCTITIRNYYFRPSLEPASVEKMAFPLPEKPSIAVLPFDNMSGHPEQDYIADGFTENITTGLSLIPELFVIARNSAFTYKGKPVQINQVSEELGVRYVLEGSIQKAGDRLRVNAQLIDALKGHHLWAERYDRELKDLFTIQDEITIKILKALEVKLKRGGESAWNTTDNFEAWGHFVKGYHHFDRVTKEDNRQAIEHLEQATKLDPEYAYAWAMLSFSLYYDGVFGWSEAPAESISRAIEIMQMVAERWEGWISNYHLLMSQIYLFRGQYEKSISEAEKSVELYPNASRFRMILAGCLYRGGKPEEAIVHAKKGMRLEPYHPLWFIPNLARPYEMLGRYEEAIALWNSYVERAHKEGLSSFDAHLGLAMDYVKLNRMTEAQNHAAEIIKLNPQYTAEIFRKSFNIKDRTYVKSRANLLIKAGIPEHPPLKLPDKPSIAVLPFDNMSKDPEQEYFADGMTDDLITDLSKISGLFVIARNSTFQYKGKAVDVKKVSRELGIRYVLEGSVRKAGDKVRINAQLIDATTGGHLWAERYDGHMEDIFSLQDKITQKIVTALTVKLTTGEKENIASKGTDNIEAYDAFLKGWQHYLRGTPESFAQAIAEFGKAVELDPDFSRAYAALALVHLKAGSSKEWYDALRTDYFTLRVKARNFLNIALKNPTSLAYRVASSMDLRRRNHDKALLNAEKAIALNPSDAESQFAMAEVLVYIGRPKEAIQIIKSVMKLDPNRMPDCLQLIGIAHFCLEEYEAAIASFNRAMKYNPAFRESSMIASTYGNLGKDNEARAAFEIIKKRYLEVSAKGETATITKLNLQPIVYHQPFINSEVTQRFIDGLIKAGWPEPHRYYEVYKENKLIGDEVRNLVIGKTQVLASFAGGGWKQKFSKDGTVDYKGYEMHDAGVYQLEGDQCCITMKKILAGLPLCSDLYRNPSGTSEKKNEYLQVNDFGIYPVSYVD